MGYILTLRSLWGLPPFLPSARRAAEVENGATLFDGREMERGSLRAAETRGVEGGATGRKTGEKTLRAVADAIRLMIAGEVSIGAANGVQVVNQTPPADAGAASGPSIFPPLASALFLAHRSLSPMAKPWWPWRSGALVRSAPAGS